MPSDMVYSGADLSGLRRRDGVWQLIRTGGGPLPQHGVPYLETYFCYPGGKRRVRDI